MAGGKKRGQVEALIRLVGEDGVSQLVEDVQRKITKISKNTEEAAQETRNLKDSWSQVSAGMGGAIVVAKELMGVAAAIGQSFTDAAVTMAVEGNFNSQFSDAAATLEKFSKAVAGTVGRGELQKFAIQAKNAGISTAEFARIAETAAKLTASGAGAARGITTTAEALEELMDSIIGASDSNLEKFGIIFDMPSAKLEFAKAAGIAVDNIDKEVESLTMLDFVLNDVGEKFKHVDLGDSSLVKVQQMNARFEELGNRLQQTIIPAMEGVASVLEFILPAFDDVDTRMADIGQSKEFRMGVKGFLAEIGDDADFAFQSIERVAKSLEEAGLSGETAATLVKGVANEFVALQNKGESAADITRRTALAVDQLAFAFQRAGDPATANALKGVLQDVTNLASRAAEKAEKLQTALEDITIEGPEKFTNAKRKRRGGRRKRDIGDLSAAFRQASKMAQARREMQELYAVSPEQQQQLEFQQRELQYWLDLNDTLTRHREIRESMAGSFESMFGGGGLESFVGDMFNMTDAVDKFTAAGGSSAEAWGKAAPGMIAASGQVAASFIGDQRIQAIVMAAMEGAASISAFAYGDIKGGALHAAAAIQYGIAAAKAGGSASGGRGGGRGGGSRSPRLHQPTDFQQGERASNQVTIHMKGAFVHGGNQQQFIRTLGDKLTEEQGRRSAVNPEFTHG